MDYFVDTGAFYALEDPSDKNHGPAWDLLEKIKDAPVDLITSNFVICESLNLIKARLGQQAAFAFGKKIRQSRLVLVRPITPELENDAWEIFGQYADKGFSYTDCTSFALIKQNDIKTAFAFDKHFAQFGLCLVPEYKP